MSVSGASLQQGTLLTFSACSASSAVLGCSAPRLAATWAATTRLMAAADSGLSASSRAWNRSLWVISPQLMHITLQEREGCNE